MISLVGKSPAGLVFKICMDCLRAKTQDAAGAAPAGEIKPADLLDVPMAICHQRSTESGNFRNADHPGVVTRFNGAGARTSRSLL